MDTNGSLTVVDALARVIATDATRPLVTYYDDATGERTELSGATLANWVAKTANLLVDGLGLGTGDVAAVALPPHWQTAAVLLGCWSAGLAIDLEPTGQAVQVGFATADRLDQVRADETTRSPWIRSGSASGPGRRAVPRTSTRLSADTATTSRRSPG